MKLPNVTKILYATDLSENARYAFGYAASLSARYSAPITILHVLEELSPTALMMVGDIIGETRWVSLKKEKEELVAESIKERLEAFHHDVKGDFPECAFVIEDTIVTTGQPVEQILHHAETTECDLVVMGSHGQGMLAEVMIGSTSRRVLRRCYKPVLVIRLPEMSSAE